jgi:hypothetical protein
VPDEIVLGSGSDGQTADAFGDRQRVASLAVPARAEAETPATPPTERQIGSDGEDATKIPTSDYRRVRVLAEYGLTLGEVAELYAVALSEVARIVRA